MKYSLGRNNLAGRHRAARRRAEYYTPILALIKKPSKSFQSLIMKLLTVNADFPPTRSRGKKED